MVRIRVYNATLFNGRKVFDTFILRIKRNLKIKQKGDALCKVCSYLWHPALNVINKLISVLTAG